MLKSRISIIPFTATVLAVLGGPPAGATPPSFDCGQAHQPLAATICSDPQLSTLDLSFAQAYQALRQQVGPQHADEIRQEAVEFQRNVIQNCNLPATLQGFDPERYKSCIDRFYHAQREAWRARLSGDAAEEAALPPQELIEAQEALRTAGYLPSDSTIDGLFGPTSRSALIEFQIANHMAPSGFLSNTTVAALLQAPQQSATQATPAVAQEPQSRTPEPIDPAAEKARLALAQAEAEKAKAEAVRAQAEAEKAKAEAETQMAINARQAAEQEAAAKAAAEAKQKADAIAKARQDAAGTAP